RIFDDAVVFTIKGESFRGRKLETVALRTSTGSPADPQQAG
ncbi:AAA family ATPase, partial [Pseudoflavonifractor phocaeensis]|nr:AAA family ATPase [Pseudoflavonifractor phocaeensis]